MSRREDAPPVPNRLDPLWILGLVVLTRLPDLFTHYQDWDEAGMMSQAWAMTRGQILYRDISQTHPVLNFAVFIPFFAWLKPAAAPHAIKALNAALVFGGACLVRRLIARWTSDRDSALAAALLFVGLLGRDWALSSYGEFYTIFPILLSAVLLQAPKPRWFAVGLLWGTAFFLKQVAVFDATALAAGFLLLRRRPAGETFRAALLIAAGGGAVCAAVSAYFARHGALAEAFDSVILHALAYRTVRVPLLDRVGYFWRLMLAPSLRDFAFCWLLGAAAFVSARRASLSGPMKLCLFWLALNLFGVWSIGKMQLHYVLVLVPPACLLAGLASAAAPPVFRAAARRALTAALFAAAAWSGLPRLRELSAERWLDPRARGSLVIAKTVREHTREDDRIFLYGINNLDVFYLSERLAAHGLYSYLLMEETFLGDPALVELARRRMRERPPALVVVNAAPDFRAASAGTRDFFSSLLRERYERVATVGLADVHRLKGP